MQKASIAWSEFALLRALGMETRRFNGPPEKLIALVRKHWPKRSPGTGRKDRSQVVIVPIREKNIAKLFNCSWLDVKSAKRITGKVGRRQAFEDPFVTLRGSGKALPALCAKVVLYSAATLLEDGGKRSSRADWEIVAVLTGPWEKEPMDPLTMARNFLRKPGGTYAAYTARQFAESIYFWSQYIQQRP